jgi:phosphate transport system substrate-binding protein
MRSKLAVSLATGLAWVGLTAAASAQVKVDKDLAAYKSVRGVAGQMSSVGSDTMNNLMTLWGEGFKKQYPRVVLAVEGKGSATAPQALIEGTAAFGPMSRDMKSSEIDAFEKKFGYKPTQLPVAIDMLAVYVHRDNPIKGLTLQQVDAIFSRTRKGGLPSDVRTWGDLGLEGEWKDKPISAYGRNSASGTYGYFKEHALFGGDFRDSVKEQPGSSSVVQSVGRDKYAIGYSGIGYLTSEVRAVPLAQSSGEFVPADPDHAYTGDYPLSRRLLLSLNYKPGAPLDPLRREFVRYVYSKQGQQDVVKDGYYPVTARMAAAALKSIGADGAAAKGK